MKIDYRIFLAIVAITLLLYLPSLFGFFKSDDFFILSVSQISSVSDLVGFFNFWFSTSGHGFYRPIGSQLFYSLAWFINFDPVPLYLLNSGLNILAGWIVLKLVYELTKNNKVAYISCFLYLTSATHFGHHYYLATTQEVFLGIFCFGAVYFFTKFLNSHLLKYYLIGLGLYLAALMSKESATSIPVILVLVYWYLGFRFINFKETIYFFTPFILLTLLYLYFHFFHYGVVTGDSYKWDFSLKILNTVSWYLLWSLNMPEMLVDFVGPKLQFNQNLFKYFGQYVYPIFGLFAIEIILIIKIISDRKKMIMSNLRLICFLSLWFLIGLNFLLFLPWHKFSYELTVPLFAIVLGLALFLKDYRPKFILSFLIIWLSLSVATNVLTYKTHWITQADWVAKRTQQFFEANPQISGNVLFIDRISDQNLPYLPSTQLKMALSDNNFFEVLYNSRIKAYYGKADLFPDYILPARNFINY